MHGQEQGWMLAIQVQNALAEGLAADAVEAAAD
jgi:hypothetical protein